MARKDNTAYRRRLRSSYFTSVISTSLVLFLIGIAGLLIINGQQINKKVRENIGFNVILKEGVKEADIYQLQKILDAKSYVLSTDYITKEEAALETEQALGEDFVSFLGYNPLPPSIRVRLHAAYTRPDSVMQIEQEIMNYEPVLEVYYKKSLLYAINENIRQISIILVGFSALLAIIAITLINNTIRLSIYSRRFLINTMQLVGATRSFIRKPFLKRSLLNGFLAAIIAMVLLGGIIYLLEEELESIISLSDMDLLILLSGVVLLTGIIISLISTFFAVNKYLNINTDKLYY